MKIQQITKRTQTKHFIAKLILAVLLIFPSTSQANTSTARSTEMPIVEWTVRDVPDFRWHFLENVKTRKLWHATPEKGTFSHHGFLAYHRGVLFACWDSQARDENVSGQHGVFTYSNNKGKHGRIQDRCSHHLPTRFPCLRPKNRNHFKPRKALPRSMVDFTHLPSLTRN